MQPKSPKLLEDIRHAVVLIMEVVSGKNLGPYPGAKLLGPAVERHFVAVVDCRNSASTHSQKGKGLNAE